MQVGLSKMIITPTIMSKNTDDYDYGDDDTTVNDADGALDDSLITYRPVIISESSKLDVDKLPGDNCFHLFYCDKKENLREISIILSKEDSAKTIIAMGTTVLDQAVFVQTKSGEEAEIVCQVHAVPKPTITLTKDGQTMTSTAN